jgi:hypothetical protein
VYDNDSFDLCDENENIEDNIEVYEPTYYQNSNSFPNKFQSIALEDLEQPSKKKKSKKIEENHQCSMGCVICIESAVDSVLLKCGHAVMCLPCALIVAGSNNNSNSCPICREPIETVLYITTAPFKATKNTLKKFDCGSWNQFRHQIGNKIIALSSKFYTVRKVSNSDIVIEPGSINNQYSISNTVNTHAINNNSAYNDAIMDIYFD